MIKFTTIQTLFIYTQSRLHLLVILSWLVVAGIGQIPDAAAGWTLPASAYTSTIGGVWKVIPCNKKQKHRRRRRREKRNSTARLPKAILYSCIRQMWRVVALRSLFLFASGLVYGEKDAWRLGLIPLLVWGWYLSGLIWPRWANQPEWQCIRRLSRHVERAALIITLVYLVWMGIPKLVVAVHLQLQERVDAANQSFLLGMLCCTQTKESESQVQLGSEFNEDGRIGCYTATLQGHFSLTIAADDPFRRRLLILFLRMLDAPDSRKGSRRTRDGRTPAVSQQALAAAYDVTQPEISRWERYWLNADWRRLLSVRSAAVLTLELQDRIVGVFAQFPWWGVDKVHGYLNEQGVKVSQRQVRQASQESGWSRLRQELTTRYHLTKESIRPRDEWLVTQLLSCNSELLARLETGERLAPQVLVEITDVMNLTREVVGDAPPPLKALPWAFRLERLLLGSWEMVADEQVRCTYCGSTHVARKSNKPRIKTYYDEAGVAQTVEVYRFYCRNADCEKGSFTHLPAGLQLYSPYRVQTHLLAAQLVGWGQVNYRRAAVALGVSPATVYRWVTAGGTRLLPIAAIFGVVRCSGVIGVDEKYVLVPKNDKPYPENGRRTMRRWMYVSVAVDCYTCDLLHIAIYPYQNAASSRTFLLALRAKGYRPRVIVTDLLQSYDSIIASVFPHAIHHECVFHALQAVQRSIKSIYGADYGRDAPYAQQLKEDIYAIFDARTRPTAVKRYERVLSLQQQYVVQNPDAEAIFIFLRGHWPKLVNSIGSKTIPNTNNAAERLIRRFDQHYQNFCGFESLDSARCFIAIFERSYRFTPFSQDAQIRIRGKCPLEVAGYDVARMPLTAVAAGWSPDWPLETKDNFVPSL